MLTIHVTNGNDYNDNTTSRVFKFKNSKVTFKTLTKQTINTQVGKIDLNEEEKENSKSEIDFKLNLLYSIDRNTSTKNGIPPQELSDERMLFKLLRSNNSIELLTNRILLTSKKFFFNLIAFNKTNDFFISSKRVIVKVFNEDHLIPKFLINPYNIQISENTPVNTLILRVCAFYTDDMNEDDGISSTNENVNSVVYKIESGSDERHFSLNTYTGEIRTKQTGLDYGMFKMTIQAVNYKLPQYVATTVVNIKIIDNSNLVFLFNQTDYNISLSESLDYINKPVIFQLNPIQANSPRLSYALVGSKIDLNTFEVNEQKGSITLIDKLDYELKSAYKLTIIVTDSSLQPIGYSYINLNVNILDINNNPPKFTEPAYYFNILNTSTVSTNLVVGLIEAYDRDSVFKNNSKIGYFIDNYKLYANFPFQIGSLNGSIYLTTNGELNLNVYDFNVIAKDRYGVEPECLSSTVNVRIKVININENYLFKFDNPNYVLNVSEEAIIGTDLLTLTILNIIDRNTTLNFLVNSGNSENTFLISRISKAKAQLSLNNELSYRKQSHYSLLIKAIDKSGLYATTNVVIHVIPINSQQPRFTKDLYEFQVYENSSIDTLIGNVNAIDGDSDENGRIKYVLENNLLNEFKLDENNGNLFVSSKLDREVFDTITLYVIASDNGTPQRTDRALIKLRILDCNDNRPEFTKIRYAATIYEDSKIGTYLMRVEAIDKDVGDNAIIRYSFSSTNLPFAIDQVSGIIRVSGRLDREVQDFYNITLIATDTGNLPLFSNTTLEIGILDVNDNAPNFGSTEISFVLLENMPIGTEIGNITANDPDLGINADIVYKMIDGFEYFELKPSGRYNTVILTNKFIADFEGNKNEYTFNLRAYSSLLFTDVSIKVQIKDMNDNSPILSNPFKIVFNNYKNNFLVESFARIPAHDLDASDSLTYRLLDSIGKQFVNLNPNTGEFMLKPILNSNNKINAAFGVSVSDGVHEVQSVCLLSVLMVTDKMLAESVTISLVNEDIDQFLAFKYDNFTSAIAGIPLFSNNKADVHLFNLQSGKEGLNASLAISIDYSKDIFIPAEILQQTLYSYLGQLEKTIYLHNIKIYEDESCTIEPCLNFQQCKSNVKFSQASTRFLYSTHTQFRSISIQYDFSCTCAIGFTGSVSSVNCDLEINLCYSNPCGQNGVCVSLESSYYCICDSDFTGRNCEHNLKTLKCCDIASKNLRNLNNSSIFECQVASISKTNEIINFNLAKQTRICKGAISECKNGNRLTCDKCADNENDSSFYNKFCELRTKHFPTGKNAYIIVPGLKSRMRFKIKLTFATLKSNGSLFYNGRLNSSGHDFISLEIQNGKLLMSYSFGDYEVSSVNVDGFDVSDGRWHTITLSYSNRNFSLSIDNDNNLDVDACDLARNQNQNQTSNECVSIKFTHQLPVKCSNPFESCFRYFDFSSPLRIGSKHFEGCISDLYVNEMFVDLSDDNVLNFGAENGCKPKDGKICKKSFAQLCDKCESVWNDLIKCICSSNDFIESSYCRLKLTQNIFSFKLNGYLSITEHLKEDTISLKMEFYVKLREVRELMVIFELELSSMDEINKLSLKYSSIHSSLDLIDDNDLKLIQIPYSSINDGFWHKISFNVYQNMSLELILNDLFKKQINLKKDILINKTIAKWFIGGSVNNSQVGLDGCIKEVQRDLNYLKFQIINGSEKCESIGPIHSKNVCGSTPAESPCFNNGVCRHTSSSTNQFTCECLEGFKGEYCQHTTLLSMRLVTANSLNKSCPAKWWGKDPNICGPCNCDESLNFSPDCNKFNGKCECKSKYYKKFNLLTNKEHCVPCDCYLEGSSSLHCQPKSGQCNCLKDSGITGRRCDSCISPFAEIIVSKNTAQCQILNTNECPKTFSNNIWWSRTLFNTISNSSCPKGSVGIAFRKCNSLDGWSKDSNLFNCVSNKLYDLQLIKWHDELIEKKSELNSYQAIKLAESINQITEEADLDDYIDDNYAIMNNKEDIMNEDSYVNVLPTSNYLYANDLLIIKNLTIFLINFEISNAPSFLYIQDKYYLKNFFSSINRLLSKKYEKQWTYLKQEKSETLIDLLLTLDKYLSCLLKYNYEQQNNLILNEINLSLSNLQISMSSLSKLMSQDDQTYFAHSVKFKLTKMNQTTLLDDEKTKVSYLTAKIQPYTLPTRLLLNNDANRQLVNFKVASDIVFLNIKENNDYLNTSYNVVVEFQLKDTKSLSAILMKSLYCVYLNEGTELWSTYGAKIISIDKDNYTIKCLYNHFSIYTVMMPINYSNLSIASVPFSLATYIFVGLSILILALSNILLVLLRKLNTSLTIIYTNFCFNLFLMQIIFITGINNISTSIVLCKLTSVLLHYLHLSTFLWILVIALHLYRMLTELRDINKVGSNAPAFYYVIAYVLPSILTSLTLGIKQELYTSTFYSTKASIYCWLNVSNTYDIIYALLLPIVIIIVFSISLILLSYKESLRKTFKQTDVGLVRLNMIYVFILLSIHSFLITCIYLQLNSLNVRANIFVIYENFYLVASLIYSIVILFLFIICDRYTKLIVYKNIIERIIGKNAFLDQHLSASKDHLCNKSPYDAIKTKLNKDLFNINTKYKIDYHSDIQVKPNSSSTETTTGTLENLDNLDDLVNDLNIVNTNRKSFMIISKKNNGSAYNIGSLEGYTTTFSTDTTTNGSDVNYHIDYNNTQTLSPPSSTLSATTSSLSSSTSISVSKYQIKNRDIIDVSKILKCRESKKSATLVVNDESINEIKSYRLNNNFIDASTYRDDDIMAVREESNAVAEKPVKIEERSKFNSNNNDWLVNSKIKGKYDNLNLDFFL